MWNRHQRAILAKSIRAERRAAGMTQDELAEATGLTRRTITAIESEGRVPQADVLVRILRALGITDRAVQPDTDVTATAALIAALLERIPSQRRTFAARRIVEILADDVEPDSEDKPDEDYGPLAALDELRKQVDEIGPYTPRAPDGRPEAG